VLLKTSAAPSSHLSCAVHIASIAVYIVVVVVAAVEVDTSGVKAIVVELLVAVINIVVKHHW
jgi:hypothetical protein